MRLPKNQNIVAPKTFVVISSPTEDLAVGLAISLSQSKQNLHDKFRGSPLPPWASMVNHLPGDSDKEEILSSLKAVLDNDKSFMMVLSGYQDTKAWNSALKEFLGKRELSATFLSYGGVSAPDELAKLFQINTTLDTDPEKALLGAWKAVKATRQKSAIPLSAFDSDTPTIH